MLSLCGPRLTNLLEWEIIPQSKVCPPTLSKCRKLGIRVKILPKSRYIIDSDSSAV